MSNDNTKKKYSIYLDQFIFSFIRLELVLSIKKTRLWALAIMECPLAAVMISCLGIKLQMVQEIGCKARYPMVRLAMSSKFFNLMYLL